MSKMNESSNKTRWKIRLRNMWNAISGDLWVFLLDVVAVNAAYFLAILLRFYINMTFRPMVLEEIVPAFQRIAPWYTVACILIFGLFRLYGVVWRYAGLNDLNRIILATVCTMIVQVAGSMIFVKRMPAACISG